MANRRQITQLSRYCYHAIFSPKLDFLPKPIFALTPNQHYHHISSTSPLESDLYIRAASAAVHRVHSAVFTRRFCSKIDNSDDESEEEESNSENDEENDDGVVDEERMTKEAAEIGYQVIGPLDKTDRVFKPYEPIFAVVQIGSHQFKVSNGDCIYTEKLKYCDVNDKLLLNKVLLLGSQTQTIIGRPILPDAAVHAVVEEHALDAKVIIFKKKRRKNYRRKNGHRQELTKLRITDIQGIEKPEIMQSEKITAKKAEKVAVPA